ncbi:DNA-binding MurR/RpiR family transcriptional regulator [Pullulanibacillus pueri]|uniref:RpiR family transcriptional regulator n=2 Tax=Pullulanibacillus pueri TaxID=1437324 RepID=A0A8J2ZZB6_9BACL|nr:DNA-binding MurR/RpiR family transcriptional regulator [Pullulanibacillus pueri]GGH87201.1 RpiR family transcriptional regulator [Pullulanibacillus pueri]
MKNENHSGNIIALIRSIYPSLTKAEKKVADVVLVEEKNIIYNSLTDLAEKSNVGDTSVLRFCRHIGYKGFQEFKLALAQELETPSEVDSSDRVPLQIMKKNIQTLEETTSLMNENVLNEVVELFLSASKIVFFGVGSSGLTAEFANFRFARTGLPVEVITDSHLGMIRATLLTENDLAVIISVSGSTVDIVEIAKRANESSAKVICMTSHIKSPATRYADIVLLSASRETPTEGSAFSSAISQLHVLDVLFIELLNKLGDKGIEMIRLTAKATSRKLY